MTRTIFNRFRSLTFFNSHTFAMCLASLLTFGACGSHTDSRSGYNSGGEKSLVIAPQTTSAKLSEAISKGDWSEIELLLKDFDINGLLDDGRRPLTAALSFHKIDIAKKLIELGADKNLKDQDGKNAYSFAEDNPDFNTYLHPELFEKNTVALFVAIEAKSYTETKSLLEAGANPNSFDQQGETPLTLAIKLKFDLVARVLIQFAKTDIQFKNKAGRAPLELATESNQARIIRMIESRIASDLSGSNP